MIERVPPNIYIYISKIIRKSLFIFLCGLRRPSRLVDFVEPFKRRLGAYIVVYVLEADMRMLSLMQSVPSIHKVYKNVHMGNTNAYPHFNIIIIEQNAKGNEWQDRMRKERSSRQFGTYHIYTYEYNVHEPTRIHTCGVVEEYKSSEHVTICC